MKKQIVTLIISACVAATALTGCAVDGKQVFFEALPTVNTVFRIGSLTCSKKTALVYLANYYNIYGSAGNIDMMDASLNTDRLKSNIEKACLHRLSMVYALNVYAEENDISLSSQEKSLVEKAASKYMDSLSAADKKALNVSEKDIKNMYEKEALASKVYKSIASKTDDEVSDDEARVMDAVVITFAAGSSDKADKAEEELDNGSDIQVVAKKYSTEKKTQMTIDKSSWPQEVVDVAFDLEDGEYSVPVESGNSIYIIYCESKYDEEKSEENREKIIESRKQKEVDDIIDAQNKKDYSSIDEAKWKSVADSFDEKITTDSFFETLSNETSF
ncbi:MAG: peptidylprolyl isomerase [Candidatus Weimeria sp.]